jgi:hypothetical protein
MEEKMTVTFLDVSIDTFDEHRDIVPKLAGLVIGVWQPTSLELEQLISHILQCQYCQITLEALVTTNADNHENENYSEAGILSLSPKLSNIIHELNTRENIGSYMEVLETHGEEEAFKQFPLLAEHLKRCNACRVIVEEARLLLHQAGVAELILPLS